MNMRILLQFLRFFNAKRRAVILKKIKYLFFQGSNCSFTSFDFGTEPYLISIHNNVEIASGVRFITHDDSCLVISNYFKLNPRLDKVGSIELFDNVFIGANSIIMPNVKIGPNAIVAAGSVITKSIPPNTIYGGNPAKLIGSFEEYKEKLTTISNSYTWIACLDNKKNIKKIVDLRKKYFWENEK